VSPGLPVGLCLWVTGGPTRSRQLVDMLTCVQWAW